jgi:UTP-glucose-1-phosphate uridylyltransferase
MPTLVVLAAGIGDRYGGLKQMDPVGPHGATIIDYSIFDAVRAGFNRIVFVIRSGFEAEFRKQQVRKFEKRVECLCVHQDLAAEGLEIPTGRLKPWGTGHAVLVSEPCVEESFAVVNADDYYGRNSLEVMCTFLSEGSSGSGDYAMVGYTLRNTLSEHGFVARGVCQADESMYLTEIVEVTKIYKQGQGAYYLDGSGERHSLTGDEIVSMNLWGFTPSIFDQLKVGFRRFVQGQGEDPKAEFFISSYVDELLRLGSARVKIMPTRDTWFGLTYREDKDPTAAQFSALIRAGVYPEKLWP